MICHTRDITGRQITNQMVYRITARCQTLASREMSLKLFSHNFDFETESVIQLLRKLALFFCLGNEQFVRQVIWAYEVVITNQIVAKLFMDTCRKTSLSSAIGVV